jgi:endonuclease G
MPTPLPRLTLPLLLLLAGCGFPRTGTDTSPDTGADSEPRAGSRGGTPDLPAGPAGNRNVRFGMAAPAGKDREKDREAFLIARPQHVLSYNAKTRTSNWVSWELKKDDIGNAKRAPFEPDPALPKGVIARVMARDYDGAGFDRGHLCPAKDRSATAADSQAVSYLTNIVPQSPAGNQNGWERLEDYCRTLARQGHVLHIACGPLGVGGTGKLRYREEIGKTRKITVPHVLWKVILVLPREGAESRKNTRAIAVIVPNDQCVAFDWPKYRVSVRDVEKLTGFRFWPAISADAAEATKSRVDDVQVRVSTPWRSGGSGEKE